MSKEGYGVGILINSEIMAIEVYYYDKKLNFVGGTPIRFYPEVFNRIANRPVDTKIGKEPIFFRWEIEKRHSYTILDPYKRDEKRIIDDLGDKIGNVRYVSRLKSKLRQLKQEVEETENELKRVALEEMIEMSEEIEFT